MAIAPIDARRSPRPPCSPLAGRRLLLAGAAAPLALPRESSSAFRLVLTEPANGQVLVDSGERTKAADNLFVIARPGVRAAGWAVWAVDGTYTPARWPSV